MRLIEICRISKLLSVLFQPLSRVAQLGISDLLFVISLFDIMPLFSANALRHLTGPALPFVIGFGATMGLMMVMPITGT